MEYPTPRVKVTNGRLDLSDAFERATGPYDEFMARYAYTELPAAKERDGLEAVIREMRAKGMLYVPDTDPRWWWYDDRATPTEYLRETMAARRLMLAQYGPNVLQPGEPIGALRDMRLWMTYLHHRWAIESGLRYVGGMYHNIVVKGETLAPTTIVPAALQREVLGLLMSAIDPATCEFPSRCWRSCRRIRAAISRTWPATTRSTTCGRRGSCRRWCWPTCSSRRGRPASSRSPTARPMR